MHFSYWCAYGLDDHRNDPPTKECARKFRKKQGCQCHIIVKVMKGRPNVAILIFNQRLHVDENGEFFHGVDDIMNKIRSRFALNLSIECKSYVESLLLMDVSVDAIMDRHLADHHFCTLLRRRDEFLACKDILYAWRRVKSTYSQKHGNDSNSIMPWQLEDAANFFYFQLPQGVDQPFIMGIQTPWILNMMVEHSHDSIISMDYTFATNKYGVTSFESFLCILIYVF
ncbi:hypothetical protein SUGI_0062970 [Cryptomeria japonica]|nr:hypothetical protein SUGI_0062970 [Cryptomeria japonica]